MSQTDLDGEQPFIAHLVELRDRLLKAIIAVLLLFLGLAYYANPIYSYLAGPLLQHLPVGTQMIAIEVAAPFLTPFKLTLVVALFLAVPFVLYQAWAFIAPGLYRHERRMILPLLISSTALFYGGVAFAYYVVLPLVFGFLTTAAPQGVTVMTDITQYLDFILTIFFAFGICFEVPIATILLIWSGVVSREALVDKRPYVIVLAFFIGAVLTPPDVVSQTLLALPMWLLFELGLVFSRFFKPRSQEDEEPELLSHHSGASAESIGQPNADDH